MAACFVVFYKIENRTQGIAHCKPTYSRGQAKLSTACLVWWSNQWEKKNSSML